MDFKSITLVNKLLDEHAYLSDEGVSLKKEIQDSICVDQGSI